MKAATFTRYRAQSSETRISWGRSSRTWLASRSSFPWVSWV